MSFQIIAKPALNQDGQAKVTFRGWEQVDAQFDAVTGEQVKRGYVKLMFEIMDTTRKSPIKANVIGGALTGNFLTTLEALGFSLPAPSTTIDSDGFTVEVSGEADEDGFETDDTNPAEVVEAVKVHLDNSSGTQLLAKVAKNKRGYWEIDVDSLKPLKK